MNKSARTLRGNLYGNESGLHRVTAVVMPDLDYTCAAAVSRLVLVGRGGVRIHEDVFVTGLRFGAQNLAEEKVQALLDDALDASHTLQLASRKVLDRLEQQWSAEGGRLRARLEEAVARRAKVRQGHVAEQIAERHESDVKRAREIFQQFRENLTKSLDEMRRQDREEAQTLFLWEDEEQKQRQRDIAKMQRRLDDLDDEERREIEMIDSRYEDIQPYVSNAALVFAVNEQDAEKWEGQ